MEVVIGLLATAVVIYYLFFYARGRQAATAPPEAPQGFPKIRGNGKFDTEVVGESFYETNFRALLGNRYGNDTEIDCDAVLTLENDNPHDKNAVAVTIDGKRVGHLPRDKAIEFRRALRRDGFGHLQSVAVAAEVYTGDDDGHCSVRLDIPEA